MLHWAHTLCMALRMAPQPPDPLPTLGERIAQARSFHLWSQSEFIQRMRASIVDRAKEKAPSRRTLSAWENNHTSPTVRDLRLAARATGWSIGWFVDELDEHDGPDDDTYSGQDESGKPRFFSTLVGVDFAGREAA